MNNIQNATDITKIPALSNLEAAITSILQWAGGLWLLIELVFLFVGIGAQNQDSNSRYYQVLRIIAATAILSIGTIYKIIRGS